MTSRVLWIDFDRGEDPFPIRVKIEGTSLTNRHQIDVPPGPCRRINVRKTRNGGVLYRVDVCVPRTVFPGDHAYIPPGAFSIELAEPETACRYCGGHDRDEKSRCTGCGAPYA